MKRNRISSRTSMTNLNFNFPNDLIKKMIASVNESNMTDQEIRFNLCVKDDIIFSTIGSCNENKAELIGSFSAYPKENRAEVRTKDIISGYKRGIICVGALYEIVCMIRKENYKNDVYQAMQEIINRYNYIYKKLDNLLRMKDKFLDSKVKSGEMDIVDIPLDIEELKIALEITNFPGVPFGQYTLPLDVIQKMKDLIIKSQIIGKEIGFDFCANSNNMIIPRNLCIGEESCVLTKRECETGEVLIGDFHTHSHKEDKVKISISDLTVTYHMGIGYIGARDEIKCFIRYIFNGNDYEFLRKLDNEADLAQKDFNKVNKEKIDFGKKYFEEIFLWRK